MFSFQEENEPNWLSLNTYPISELLGEEGDKTISGLLPGHLYQIRLILYSTDGNVYEEDDHVPTLEAQTMCKSMYYDSSIYSELTLRYINCNIVNKIHYIIKKIFTPKSGAQNQKVIPANKLLSKT